ncbi:uncharacterized protein A4U43_C08F22560 [Asparagus officinalis]|uniref:sodium channel modifier 1-like n=1 Tax=Asparagus officinalis TaxID=4686 RepID=UPI00098E4CD8|nr:sodium channel modifier 1-like [Asparagus officinalis]ONK60783.1 uncharacterized protein A4U43_C08F22560 [Asparagus officinalis]
MSAFGGDSWAREAQYRKRRVDDLMLSSPSSSSSDCKQLSSGKLACVACPHNPVLDSPLAFSMHAKGARHIAAVYRLKERGLSRQDELNKRIALSSGSVTASSSPSIEVKGAKVQNQPLIEQTRKAILEIQSNRSWDQVGKPDSSFKNLNKHVSPRNSKLSAPNHVLETPICASFQEPQGSREMKSVVVTETAGNMLADWNNEQHKHREKELKFIAAGWKRDGFGKWYKDENVEFDSDEEDPNETLK